MEILCLFDFAAVKRMKAWIDAVCAILAAGANPIAQNNFGRTALMTAAAVGNEDLLQIVCNAQRMEDAVTMKDRHGKTALDWAQVGHHVATQRAMATNNWKVHCAAAPRKQLKEYMSKMRAIVAENRQRQMRVEELLSAQTMGAELLSDIAHPLTSAELQADCNSMIISGGGSSGSDGKDSSSTKPILLGSASRAAFEHALSLVKATPGEGAQVAPWSKMEKSMHLYFADYETSAGMTVLMAAAASNDGHLIRRPCVGAAPTLSLNRTGWVTHH